MDEQCETSNDKIQELKGESINNGIRNIDDLPEEITAHILSFLSMKEAVRTSVLSKKWEFSWTSIPNLKFVERTYSNRELFMNCVDRVLLRHDHSPIKSFHLECKILGSASRVNEWVAAAVRHNVERCTIRLTKVDENYTLPCCLFTCDTLIELDLDMPCNLRLPSQIHLPNLKHLYLTNVIFLDEYSTESLFSSPAIESLNICVCSWVNLSAISISSPILKHLTIEEISVEEGNGSDETLDYCCQVVIRDCNLETFHLTGPMFNEYVASNLSAVNVDLDIEDDSWVADQAVLLIEMLQGIDAVQALYFEGSTLCLFEDTPEWAFNWSYFPVFCGLKSLEVEDLRGEIGVLGKILQHTPHLQSLVIYEGLTYSYHGEDNNIFDLVPPCFSSSLKRITVGELFLKKGEFYVLKNMLKYATVLEELEILNYSDIDNRRLGVFCRKLMRCPRGSKNCKFSISLHRQALLFEKVVLHA